MEVISRARSDLRNPGCGCIVLDSALAYIEIIVS